MDGSLLDFNIFNYDWQKKITSHVYNLIKKKTNYLFNAVLGYFINNKYT